MFNGESRHIVGYLSVSGFRLSARVNFLVSFFSGGERNHSVSLNLYLNLPTSW